MNDSKTPTPRLRAVAPLVETPAPPTAAEAFQTLYDVMQAQRARIDRLERDRLTAGPHNHPRYEARLDEVLAIAKDALDAAQSVMRISTKTVERIDEVAAKFEKLRAELVNRTFITTAPAVPSSRRQRWEDENGSL